jgi:hypothetical protein
VTRADSAGQPATGTSPAARSDARGICETAAAATTATTATTAAAAESAALPEPGPEEGGMRLRLIAAPRTEPGREGYDVRLDVLNASQRPITLQGKWRNEETGDVKEYIEAATSIECVPDIAPWVGGVRESPRTLPQPRQVLAPGETLRVRWQTEGRRLKNRVSDPNHEQNPEFELPGLYSVHATVDVATAEGTVRLRSNEQLVPVGGSRAMPKYTRGPLWHVDREKKTATLGLGALQKAQVGDQFEIGHPKGMYWRLTITEVMPEYSLGTLELLTRSTYPPYSEPPLPFMQATLVPQK